MVKLLDKEPEAEWSERGKKKRILKEPGQHGLLPLLRGSKICEDKLYKLLTQNSFCFLFIIILLHIWPPMSYCLVDIIVQRWH